MAIWPGQKKEEDADPIKIEIPEGSETAADAGSGSESPPQLNELTRRLGELGQILNQTNDQLVAYLVHRESQAGGSSGDGAPDELAKRIEDLADKLDNFLPAAPSSDDKPAAAGVDEAALGAALQPVRTTLDQLASHVNLIGEAVTNKQGQDLINSTLAQLQEGINQQFGSVAQGMQTVYQRLDGGLNALAEQLKPEEPEEDSFGPAVSGDWQTALLGRDLSENPNLEFHRQRLFAGLLENEPAACSLVGQLLVFRSALVEKMPPLLKEIGEAYYRWQPKTAAGHDAMEEALVGWIRSTMQEAGIGNTIELVNPGERFDSTRHAAAARGVEIAEVLGWIVLRDNGKVYTKASVVVT